MNHCLISFKSRNSVFAFARILNQYGINNRIINTPKGLSNSCSLSIETTVNSVNILVNIYRQSNINDLIGIFVNKNGNYYKVI